MLLSGCGLYLVDPPAQLGLKLNDRGPDVGRLQNYLKKFGYIRPNKVPPLGGRVELLRAISQPQNNMFDNTTRTSLKLFQLVNKLPVTGILDKYTLNLMSKPRCGVPDIVIGDRIGRYVAAGTNWSRLVLTYTFENYTSDISQDMVKRAIEVALGQWTLVTPLTFSEVSSETADIKISFALGDHNDGYPFSSPEELAHAFFPEDGRLHFDESEIWTVNNPPSGTDFTTVALHELGHILGLSHSNNPEAIMYAYYGGRRHSLHTDDIAGIQSIYGGGQLGSQWYLKQKIVGLWCNYESSNVWINILDIGWKKIGGNSPDAVTNLLTKAVSAKSQNREIDFYEQNGEIREIYL